MGYLSCIYWSPMFNFRLSASIRVLNIIIRESFRYKKVGEIKIKFWCVNEDTILQRPLVTIEFPRSRNENTFNVYVMAMLY